jgi:trans-aconitate 2-methyltransferase
MWDAEQYLKYSEDRSRPFIDLLARVQKERVGVIVDLGCGPGNLTRTLIERWPSARVIGIDDSPEMLGQAKSSAIPARGDITLLPFPRLLFIAAR